MTFRNKNSCRIDCSYKSVITSLLGISVLWSFKKDGGKQRKGYGSNENVERKERISGLLFKSKTSVMRTVLAVRMRNK